MLKLKMIFDVESVGLHGEGFAVGWVITENDREIDSGYASCDHTWAYEGATGDRDWIKENVVPHLPPATIMKGSDESHYTAPAKVRKTFWTEWLKWKAKGATLWADCAWPVEAKFLLECVEDDKELRNWEGPYPLCEISTVLICASLDPLAKYDRLLNETPAHHPTCDARQSARLLKEAIAILNPKQRLIGE
jgi:hypothetical protein